MTGTLLPEDDESSAVNAELADATPWFLSALVVGISFLIIFVLAWIAISVVRDQGRRGSAAEEEATVVATEVPTLIRGDEVQVSIGPSGHQVAVACFLPAPDSPPLVVFASAAPNNLDLRAEATLIDDTESSYRTVARADALRPGEQRETVPRTVSNTKVVVEREVVDCRIERVQADRQVIRFG